MARLSRLCLGHKLFQDFGERAYTKHDECHTRFIELQEFNVDESARSQLDFSPPGTMGSLQRPNESAKKTVRWRAVCLEDKLETAELRSVNNQCASLGNHFLPEISAH